MRIKSRYLSFALLLFFLYYQNLSHLTQAQPTTTGYPCSTSQAIYPCQTYVLFRALAPDFLDLASIGDLFSVSRPMIAKPSNVSNTTNPLQPDEFLFAPINCGCNLVNSTFGNISYAALNYTIRSGDTFWKVSTQDYQNLTTFYSVEVVNPTLVPTNLVIGVNAVFPIFCKCPNSTQRQNRINYLISYVFRPADNFSSLASRFGSTTQSIIDVNGNNIRPFDTVFIPVSRLPQFSQPNVSTPPPPPPPAVVSSKDDRKGAVIGLGIGLGICGLLLILVLGLWLQRDSLMKKKLLAKRKDVEKQQFDRGEKALLKDAEVSLLAEVSDYLDKYKVFGIEELREATDDFDDSLVIQGSVYKGSINGEVYAIKKMNWNAYEQLKILQKVNHGNLVKLEGFCIDPEEANCYLVYEYVENGSLHSWLHGNKNDKLNWKTRLRIAIDVANGLQYIHEHTRPQVVHKDIKSSNILLDSSMRAKIANFGLAKSGCNAITMHIVGTQGYIAPEYLTDGMVSTKMDVFSFGVVLHELISGKEAIDEEGKVLWAKVDRILEGTDDNKVRKLKEWMDYYLLKESISMESVMNVMTVAIACVSKDPLKRPSMVDIVYALCKSDDVFSDVSQEGSSPRSIVTAR
ncbi:hypothetical protein ACH5RR_031405 [Cinchona calisaya]|uniref:Protein kinase domain-containing protein n=1 Tax=Cinchona calisaya TaxID=153742 RepID=A0ABD2YF61_9GENT